MGTYRTASLITELPVTAYNNLVTVTAGNGNKMATA